MERLLYRDLLAWKRQAARKPVLLDGARQTGKSHLVSRQFGPREFRRCHRLDFREAPALAGLFADGLDPRRIVRNVELHLDTDVDLAADLLFFDEVGDCQPAVDSLRYFAEELPGAFVCASGSNIGLLGSFPVGSVHWLELFPLCFEEFLMASGQTRLPDALLARRRDRASHEKLWSALLDYWFVGGMPEAVAAWFGEGGDPGDAAGVRGRAEAVARIHRALLDGYRRDFGKYAGRRDAGQIEAVFLDVPRQLAAVRDGSAKRYRFKGAIAHKRRYRELAGPIDWLEKARLVWKCFVVEGRPSAPLAAQSRANRFKLFLFDVGLLGAMLDVSYREQRAQGMAYKGFVAENFVQTEMRARVGYPAYGWSESRAEVEFLHRGASGDVVPVEVKSGARTRAKSLRSYIDRYAPPRAVKLAGTPGAPAAASPAGTATLLETWPLYEAQFLRDL